MVIPVLLRRADGTQVEVNGLVDSGAEVNLIDPLLAKELAWEPFENKATTIRGIGGQQFSSYRTYEQKISVVDSWRQCRTMRTLFHAIESDGYSIILGYPWLETADPQISFKEKRWRIPSVRHNSEENESDDRVKARSVPDNEAQAERVSSVRLELDEAIQWRYPVTRERLELQTAEHFIKDNMAESARVYAICLHSIIDDETLAARAMAIGQAVDTGSSPRPESPLPVWLQDYADVFDTTKAGILPPHSRHEHAIEIEGGEPPYGPLYNLSVSELRVLREYLDDALAKGWIRPSTSPAGAPILFVPKKDGTLRLCVDYRGLNRVTKKNRYPLPLINETMDRLVGAKIFTKLDLKDAYHRLRIKKGDEWKTAFRTRYGHFEYLVMPFGLANAPATFQAYINQALQGHLDTICVVYLDDILIYSQDLETHREHVYAVLERLRKFGLYANPKKCQFCTDRVEFLGFIVGVDGIQMDARRVQTIQDWPPLHTVRDLQVFLGFANFYRRFIAGYSRIVAPLTDQLRGGKQYLDRGERENEAIERLKKAFTTAPLLRHFDPSLRIFIETDASGFAIACVLSQLFPGEKAAKTQLRPIAYWSRKLLPAEANYETHDAELLAVVSAFKHWRHYLEGSMHTITVLTDHNNLQYFMTTKELNGRQARWAEKLARFDFIIQHRPGKLNPADAPSRRPDYEMTEAERASIALSTLQNLLQTQKNVNVSTYHADDLAVETVNQATQESESNRPSTDLAAKAVNQVERGMAVESPGRPLGELASAQPALLQRLQRVLSLAIETKASDSLVSPNDGWSTKNREESRTVTESGIDARLSTGDARGGRLLSTGDTLASHDLNVHDDADAEQPRWLEPSAGASYCSSYVPRSAIVAAIGTQTAYDIEDQTLSDIIKTCQRGDAFAQEKMKTLQANHPSSAGETKGWHIDAEGLLRKQGKIFIPGASALRTEILQRSHDDPLAGHFGFERTTQLIRKSFFWATLEKDVKEYIASCDICQRTKTKRHRPYGELASLPVPEGPWQEITMDFIIGLPPSRRVDSVYDSVLVVVDRFTKMAKYIPCRKTIDAEQLAELLIGTIFKDFGLPKGIVSDRGSVFTSNFWSSVCWTLRIKRRLSTAFHPQTDGQTERQNQTLEQYLRQYCTYHQDDWASLLSHAEFAYNNSVHASTRVSPFFALYGFHPRVDINVEDNIPGGEVPTAVERAKQIAQIREESAQRLRQAGEF
jgi:hypothetical protein